MHIDFDKVNSATKYPSILTYHKLGPRGRIESEVLVPFDANDEVIITEKIDGTNGRIIMLPLGVAEEEFWLIGSREELLTAEGDRIHNPAMGIVDALRPWAARCGRGVAESIRTYYFEVYGHGIAGGKTYTKESRVGARLLDVSVVPASVLEMSRAEIAAWRDAGNQEYADELLLHQIASGCDLPLAPRGEAYALPDEAGAMLEFLHDVMSKSSVGLDPGGTTGRPEGVVVRTPDRKKIAKIRFEDYERTLKQR